MIACLSTESGKRGDGCIELTAERGILRETLKRLSRDMNRSAAWTAQLLTEVQEGRYWLEWGYRSFRKYVESECAFAHRTAQSYVSTYQRLKRYGVTAEQLSRLEWSKAELVARVLNAGNREWLLEDLDRLSYRDLKEKVRSLGNDIGVALSQAGEPRSAVIPGVSLPAGPVDWRLPKPAEDEFYVADMVWEQLCYAVGHGKNLLLIGPSGCGKTEVFARIAAAAVRPFVEVNCGAMSEPRTTLIGVTHLDRRKGTRFLPSRFARAVQTVGSCILLDELSRAGRDAFNILLSVTVPGGYLALDESEDAGVIRRAPGVTFFATANLGMEYTGADQLDRAVAERFPAVIAMDFPPSDKERRLLKSRCPGLTSADARRLVEIAARQRELAREGEFVGSVSTRALLAAGEQIAAGIPFENALKFCILNRFSADGGEASEQAKLLQIAQGVGTFEAAGAGSLLADLVDDHYLEPLVTT